MLPVSADPSFSLRLFYFMCELATMANLYENPNKPKFRSAEHQLGHNLTCQLVAGYNQSTARRHTRIKFTVVPRPTRGVLKMEINFEQMRFRVTRSDAGLTLSGALTDATNYSHIAEMKGSDYQIDLSGVTYSSYLGACKLLKTLDEELKNYTFINVPYSIFQVLSLTDGADKVQSFQNRYAVKNNTKIQFFDHFETIKTASSKTNENRPAGMSLSFLLLEKNSPVAGSKDTPGWLNHSAEEVQFWRDYLAYFANTLVQCEQVLASTIYAVNRYFNLFCLRIDSFSRAWEFMKLQNRRGDWEGQVTVKKTMEHANRLTDSIQTMIQHANEGLAKILFLLDDKNESVFGILERLEDFSRMQLSTAAFIEDAGVSLGEILGSIKMFVHVRADLNLGLSSTNFDSANLPKLLEILGIMNPDAETDLEEARSEILAEAQLAERDLSACIVVLQSFDLVRQILEHRDAEVKVLLKNMLDYKNQNCHWTIVRDLVIDKLTAKMVTDQEKKAFGYFLKYLQPSRDSAASSSPGDVMMF